MDLEIEMILNSLARAGIAKEEPSSASPNSLSDAPPAVVYHMVSSWAVTKDSRILSFFHSHPPSEPFLSWPTDPPPPGLFLLIIDDHEDVRKWAKAQVLTTKVEPILFDNFTTPYIDALGEVVSSLARNGSSAVVLPPFIIDTPSGHSGTNLPPSEYSSVLWSSFCYIIRLIPPRILTSSPDYKPDIRRIVVSHLHDTGPRQFYPFDSSYSHDTRLIFNYRVEFASILRCLLVLLKRLGKEFWRDERPDFPQIVFDSIKDNPAYSNFLMTIMVSVDEQPWFLAWFGQYLQTIDNLPIYEDVFAKMVSFMCEELQHERFREARPSVMIAVARVSCHSTEKV
jgi:senataxin